MRIWDAAITQRRQLTGEFVTLSLQFHNLHPFDFEPGQFIMLGLPEKLPWVLRKPFTILEAGNGRIELLLSCHPGDGRWLDDIREGTGLDFIGPLGKPFHFDGLKGPLLILCEGGGISAAFAAAKKATKLQISTTVIWSGPTASDFPLESKFSSLGLNAEHLLKVTGTGEGGVHSSLIQFLRSYLKSHQSIFVSGSDKFINKAQSILAEYGREGQLAIAPREGCGVGVCLACIVKTKDGYRRACVSGPVFSTLEEISL